MYFTSAAYYYARFRPFYPDPVIRQIIQSARLKIDERVIDIGAGTGQLAIQLSPFAHEIVCIEPDADMIKEGCVLATSHQSMNLRWIQTTAEELDMYTEGERFKLATFGASFHWMNHDVVLSHLDHLLTNNGVVAVLGSKSIWMGNEPWEQAAKSIIQSYLGEHRRAGTGKYKTAAFSDEPFKRLLQRSAFCDVKEYAFKDHQSETLDQVVGRIFSTSFANPAVLGNKKPKFEDELRNVLRSINPSGNFEKTDVYYLFIGKRVT